MPKQVQTTRQTKDDLTLFPLLRLIKQTFQDTSQGEQMSNNPLQEEVASSLELEFNL